MCHDPIGCSGTAAPAKGARDPEADGNWKRDQRLPSALRLYTKSEENPSPMEKEDDVNVKIGEEEAMPAEILPTTQKRKKRKKTVYLPEVLVVDVLSRLPVKSLLRFRCVCKLWYSLITDPAFVKMHLSRSLSNNCNLSLIFRDRYIYSVDLDACEKQPAVKLRHPLKSPDYLTSIFGSCNGLLCISNSEKEVFLWNPSTRRHQKLPVTPIEYPGDVCFAVYGFGYDPTTDDYKLVRVVQFFDDDGDEYPFASEVKVYSLSTNSWRRIGDMPFHISYKRGSGVLANSALHWVAKRETEPETEYDFILSFDLQDEKHREVPLPDFVDEDEAFGMNVGVLGGQLCMICNFFRIRVEVWVMKDYGVKDSWAKLFLIEQPLLTRSYENSRPICYSKNGDIILENDLEVLDLYDPRKENARNLRLRGVPNRILETETCVGSLVQLSAKDGTEQIKRKKKNRKPRTYNYFY